MFCVCVPGSPNLAHGHLARVYACVRLSPNLHNIGWTIDPTFAIVIRNKSFSSLHPDFQIATFSTVIPTQVHFNLHSSLVCTFSTIPSFNSNSVTWNNDPIPPLFRACLILKTFLDRIYDWTPACWTQKFEKALDFFMWSPHFWSWQNHLYFDHNLEVIISYNKSFWNTVWGLSTKLNFRLSLFPWQL